MERCPACHARLTGDDACRRCGCEIHLTRQAQQQSRQALQLALAALVAGHIEQAQRWAVLAQTMDSSATTLAIAGFVQSYAARRTLDRNG